jgi:hypothetical protein
MSHNPVSRSSSVGDQTKFKAKWINIRRSHHIDGTEVRYSLIVHVLTRSFRSPSVFNQCSRGILARHSQHYPSSSWSSSRDVKQSFLVQPVSLTSTDEASPTVDGTHINSQLDICGVYYCHVLAMKETRYGAAEKKNSFSPSTPFSVVL